jgi:hypothetical protein
VDVVDDLGCEDPRVPQDVLLGGDVFHVSFSLP